LDGFSYHRKIFDYREIEEIDKLYGTKLSAIPSLRATTTFVLYNTEYLENLYFSGTRSNGKIYVSKIALDKGRVVESYNDNFGIWVCWVGVFLVAFGMLIYEE